MDMMLLGLGLGVGVTLIFVAAIVFARSGNLNQAWWGLTVAGHAGRNPSLGAKIDTLVGNPSAVVPVSKPTVAVTPPPVVIPPVPPTPPKPTGEALRVLSLLQAEARLVDFLMEDISGAPDAAVGAGVREVHKKAAATIKKYFVIETVLGGAEGDRVTVQKGFNPSAIRVLGNVTGEPPYSGELQHAGWKVKELKLPGIADGQDPFVLQPAEVQM